MGRKIGVKINTAGVASSGIPMINRITIMMSRNMTGESVTETSHSPISRGMLEKVIA